MHYIPPEQIKLGVRDDYRKVGEETILKKVECTAEFISIKKTLKTIFEFDNVFHHTMAYYNYLMTCNHVISNFVQAEFWRRKVQEFGDKIVLPIFLHFNDYENNNALGSHAGVCKCGAVYFTIPCLPPEFVPKLNNIFLYILFNTIDHKIFKNKIIFKKVVEELHDIKTEGLVINCNGADIRVFFPLALVLGDNLGMNSVLGYVDSF